MRVGVACFAGDGGTSGIGTYLRNLVAGFRGQAGRDGLELVLYVPSEHAWLGELDGPACRVFPVSRLANGPLANILWHWLVLPLLAWRDGLDVLFLPAGNRRLLPWAPCPVVATVHDLSQLHVSGKYDRARMFYVTRVLATLMKRCARVICVSEATSQDVAAHAGVDQARLRVVYNGLDLGRFVRRASAEDLERLRARYGIEGRYLLYTARLEHPGKNHVRLLDAFATLRSSPGRKDLRLVLAGASWSGAEYVRAAAAPLGEAVIFPGFVDGADLPALYSCAEAFVFPSMFEGFGLPLLEAMACGTPVACSDVSSLPEVGGDAVAYFSPTDPGSMVAALERILDDDAYRRDLVSRGASRASGFSWDVMTAHTLLVIRETVEGRTAWTRERERPCLDTTE